MDNLNTDKEVISLLINIIKEKNALIKSLQEAHNPGLTIHEAGNVRKMAEAGWGGTD